jgi:hypothetical protein
MERESALEKLEQYEQAAKTNPKLMRDLDRGIMQGYRVLAKGGRLIDANDALIAGGLNIAGIPRLAIARAHVEACRWEPTGEYESGSYSPNGGGKYRWSGRWQRMTDDRVEWTVPKGSFPAEKIARDAHRRIRNFEAQIPLVPLPLRPRHNLSNYFVLWEANWHPVPPRDPYLLRKLAGSLMEIVAEWELTDLEVAAVASAMRKP